MNGHERKRRPEQAQAAPALAHPYSNVMEPPIRGLLSERTGQYFQEGKHPSASGPDIERRSGLIRINLLPPSD